MMDDQLRLEDLMRAMYAALPGYDLPGGIADMAGPARAAVEFYRIPPSAEKGAVGVLVDALDRAIGICQGGFNICEECPVKKPGGCMYLDAKRALGELEVT